MKTSASYTPQALLQSATVKQVKELVWSPIITEVYEPATPNYYIELSGDTVLNLLSIPLFAKAKVKVKRMGGNEAFVINGIQPPFLPSGPEVVFILECVNEGSNLICTLK